MRARYSQNFLVDQNVARKIVDAASLSPADTVVEIGPGRGILTRQIAAQAGRLIAVEIDGRLAKALREALKDRAGAEVLCADFLDPAVTLDTLPSPLKFISNLPYAVTSPALNKICAAPRWDLAVVMVQREVADRIMAEAGSSAYGILTIAVQFYAEVEKVMQVSRTCFKPRPTVDSTVIRLRRRNKPAVDVPSEEKFFKVVRAAFGQRRKTLLNALSAGLDGPKPDILPALEQCGIAPERRGETLSIPEFAALTRALDMIPARVRLDCTEGI